VRQVQQQLQRQVQYKFKCNDNGEIQGSLHCGGKCAASGRDDVFLGGGLVEDRQPQVQRQLQRQVQRRRQVQRQPQVATG